MCGYLNAMWHAAYVACTMVLCMNFVFICVLMSTYVCMYACMSHEMLIFRVFAGCTEEGHKHQ